VILIDVDHTLLDGDAVRAAITAAIEATAGSEAVPSFWAHYESEPAELGAVDVPETARRLEAELGLAPESVLAALAAADFASCLHAGALAALDHLAGLGLTVVLSDGDARFQRAKIAASGLAAAVEGRVLVVPHKEHALDLVAAAYPAAHYALLDDRAGILGAAKAQLGERLTAVRIKQGRYIDEPSAPGSPAPDLELPSIEVALSLDERVLLGGAGDLSRT
jgi:hypothetical protein